MNELHSIHDFERDVVLDSSTQPLHYDATCSLTTPRHHFFLVSYVGEKPWWPILSPNKGRKNKSEKLRGESSDQVY